MSAIPTPAGALLGASLTSEGTALPTVVIEVAVLRSQPLESLPSRPMAHEFLLGVAEKLGLNLVADHHTRSTRIEFPPTPTVQQALERAAEGYHLIIRQEGKYLMARCRFWPDRDDEEPPSPAVEEWLRLKAADQNLPLPAIEQLGRLPEVKLIG